MPKLKTVTIRRFKRLEHLELDLGDVTLLIGANNAGKSSILQAIHFAVSIRQIDWRGGGMAPRCI